MAVARRDDRAKRDETCLASGANAPLSIAFLIATAVQPETVNAASGVDLMASVDGSPDFGRVTSYYPPRRVQISLRMMF